MDLVSIGITSFIFFYVVIPGLILLALVIGYILFIPIMVAISAIMEIDKIFHPPRDSTTTDILIDKNISTSGAEGKDPLFEEAVQLVCQHDKASASLLQRRLSVGYARAARILDQLEESGIIEPGEGANARDVLVNNAEDFLSQFDKKSNKQKLSL